MKSFYILWFLAPTLFHRGGALELAIWLTDFLSDLLSLVVSSGDWLVHCWLRTDRDLYFRYMTLKMLEKIFIGRNNKVCNQLSCLIFTNSLDPSSGNSVWENLRNLLTVHCGFDIRFLAGPSQMLTTFTWLTDSEICSGYLNHLSWLPNGTMVPKYSKMVPNES